MKLVFPYFNLVFIFRNKEFGFLKLDLTYSNLRLKRYRLGVHLIYQIGIVSKVSTRWCLARHMNCKGEGVQGVKGSRRNTRARFNLSRRARLNDILTTLFRSIRSMKTPRRFCGAMSTGTERWRAVSLGCRDRAMHLATVSNVRVVRNFAFYSLPAPNETACFIVDLGYLVQRFCKLLSGCLHDPSSMAIYPKWAQVCCPV